MSKLSITNLPVTGLRPYPGNARTHSAKQIAEIATSIKAFGFNNPVLVAKDGTIIAGHGRVAAAKKLGLDTVPCVRLEHLSEAEKRAYILADNKLAEKAGWDREILAIELQHLPTSISTSTSRRPASRWPRSTSCSRTPMRTRPIRPTPCRRSLSAPR